MGCVTLCFERCLVFGFQNLNISVCWLVGSVVVDVCLFVYLFVCCLRLFLQFCSSNTRVCFFAAWDRFGQIKFSRVAYE